MNHPYNLILETELISRENTCLAEHDKKFNWWLRVHQFHETVSYLLYRCDFVSLATKKKQNKQKKPGIHHPTICWVNYR